ncbi:MAG: magnesium transporter [Planctomycetes bacterium]|nr:magnesium transporter [Planctomycetota bacterium]
MTAELLAPDIAELVQEGAFSEVRNALHGLPAADVADILATLEPSQAALAFRFMPRDAAADSFSYLAPELQERLINDLGAEGSVRVIEAMSADDRARLLDELPESVAERLVASLSPQTRASTQAILGYPPRTVGRLMTPDYLKVKADWTVAQALDHIRRHGRDAETINVVYVVDESGKLIDDLRLRQVFLADPAAKIEDLMNRNFVALKADMPQEEAVQLMARYDRTALPVIDSRGNLIGIVTADDVADVAQQEFTEDIQKVGGMAALEENFAQASVQSLVKKRAPWLALLFVSELLTSNTLRFFDDEIQKVVVLSIFVPAIISSGGNSGSQSSTLVIRALATGEVVMKDWWRVIRRELVVAVMLGLIIGSLGFLRVSLWGLMGWWKETHTDAAGKVIVDSSVQDHYLRLAAAISISLIGVVLWGSVMGALLPFGLKKMKLDPAGSSTPFVATLVDVTGIIIYFTVAIVILKGTLL